MLDAAIDIHKGVFQVAVLDTSLGRAESQPLARDALGKCENSRSRNVGMAAQPHKSCRPRSISPLVGVTQFPTAFGRPASEPRPAGRRAALLRSEAGQAHLRRAHPTQGMTACCRCAASNARKGL
jgi:hypothetical protein